MSLLSYVGLVVRRAHRPDVPGRPRIREEAEQEKSKTCKIRNLYSVCASRTTAGDQRYNNVHKSG